MSPSHKGSPINTCCIQRALFHFTSWDFDSEAASHITFESALKQLYLDWFAEYHVEAKLFKAAAAVAELESPQ
jgi:hypothetical protein